MKFRLFLAAMVITTLGTAANAGMWAEFHDRCLTLYLAGDDPDLSGLEPIPEPMVVGETIAIVQSADASFMISSPHSSRS